MANNFNTTRTPGSRSSAYDLVVHIAETDPHPQYLLKSDYQGGGSGSLDLEIHKTDPNAHGNTYVKPIALNNYYTKTEVDNNFYNKVAVDTALGEIRKSLNDYYLKTETYSQSEIDNNIYTKAEVDDLLKAISEIGITLYHDPVLDASETHAASMKAANTVYEALQSHKFAYSQSSTTDHLDNTGSELYAHRLHTHQYSELSGVAAANHNHDTTYSKLGHRHDDLYAPITHDHPGYLTQLDLESVGIYPNSIIGTSSSADDGTIDPFDFNEEVQQGNISISPTVLSTSIHGPDITTLSMTSFLNVVTEVTQDDGTDEQGGEYYGERYCSQTLTTDEGIYYRIGHRRYALQSEGVAEADLWTWGDWTPVGGGSKDIFEVFYSTSTNTPKGAFPLWTGETISNCKTAYPTFWAKALEYNTSGKIRVVTDTVYDNEVSTYGECGAFVINETAGTIRLPKITRFISSLDAVGDIGITKGDQMVDHTHTHWYSGPDGNSNPGGDNMTTSHRMTQTTLSTAAIAGSSTTIGDEVQPRHVRLALYIQVFNTITPSATTDLEARVSVLEANAIMFSRHDFIASSWTKNASTNLYEYSFVTNHFTSSHVYMTETGGSVLVDESVETHIVGSTDSGNVQRTIKLVAPQAFAGYIITLG